eukprot:14963430-Heterocapsa_arctica.AAC.1
MSLAERARYRFDNDDFVRSPPVTPTLPPSSPYAKEDSAARRKRVRQNSEDETPADAPAGS